MHKKLPHKAAHHLGQRGIGTQPRALLRGEEKGKLSVYPFHAPPYDSLPKLFLTVTPPPLPESQRLEAPQDGKAEPVEGWAGQSPPGWELLGSLAPAVLWVAER